MGISETLGNAYMRVEDAYYGVLDFFEEKGVGLPWTYNDFLETKGVPALPFTIAILAVLAGGLFYVSTSSMPQDAVFTLSLKDDKGRSLEDVSIKITDSSGKIIEEMLASDGQTITLKGVSPRETLTISATKQGYGSNSGTWLSGEEKFRLSLEGSNDAVVGKLKLVDSETGTVITNAIVSADWPETNVPLTTSPGADGIVLLNVPLNEEITLSVRADNYEDLFDVITFASGDVKVKELTPKASATQGNSVLVVKAVDAKTQLPLENVHVKIENAQSGETISDIDVSTGIHSENLTKGLVVRVSVSKEGYNMYTSNTEYPGGKTLRSEEELILAPLGFGGVTLNVVTQSESSKQPLSGVELTLVDDAEEKIDSQTSNFSGEAAFAGLNETNAYTLLAFSANFFPLRKQVDWTQLPSSESGKTMLLPLTPFVSGNAGTLTVFVSEKDGKAATQSVVSVFEKVNGTELPLIAARTPDAAGSFTARLPVGMNIVVRAQKGSSFTSEKELTIAAGLNKAVLTLENDLSAFTLLLKTKDGKPFIGNVLVESSGGNELFSGAVTDGEVSLLAPAGETITLTTTDASGGKFSKTMLVGSEREVTIVIDAALNNGTAPLVTFEGLFDVSGKPVAGISMEQDAFARFSVKWPASTNSNTAASKGGLFVRVGSDTIVSIDSQFVGVVGLNGDADTVAYGKSWNPLPKPGKETKDRATSGKAGTLNKWIEVLVEKPLGTQTFDVRLRAREGAPEGNVELFYRAFVQNANETIRTPEDAELGASSFNAKQSGLYASSLSANVSVYANLPFCQGKICAVLAFVDEENRTFNVGGFRAMEGELYALQLNVQTAKTVPAASATQPTSGEGLVPPGSVNGTGGITAGAGSATVKATTSNENPLLVFTKSEVGTFASFADTGKKDTSITFNVPGTASANGALARVHFLPENEGQTTLNVQIISGSDSFTQTIPIEIVPVKRLSVDVPEFVESGEKISVRVLDDTSTPVANALLTINDASGKFAASMKGTNTLNKGEQGVYIVDKALDAGLYTLRVSVPGYATAEEEFSVGIKTPLLLDEKTTITIPFGQTSATQNVNVTNTTKFPISSITGEVVTFGTFPKEFVVSVGSIPAIAPSGKATLPVTVTYSGDTKQTQTLTGNAQLSVSGAASLAFPVKGSTALSIVYNPKLDAKCLQFSKEKLSVTLFADAQPYGNLYNGNDVNPNVNYYGSAQQPNYNAYNSQGYNPYGFDASGAYQNAETKRVNVKVKNNCGETLDIIPGITRQDGQTQVDGLKIAAIDSSLKLANGEEKQVDFEVSNQLFRAGVSVQAYPFFATFTSAQLVASLPFDVVFSDRSRAIQAPDAVEMTLIKTGAAKAVDRVTIPITNIGGAPIYSLSTSIEGETASDVSVKIENTPNTNTGNPSILLPGQTLYPPIALVGESLREEAGVVSKRLIISGTIEGRRMILREVNVFARTGSDSCLEVSAFDTPVSFISSELVGSISKRITVQNKCLEPVRITQVESAKIGTNAFSVSSAEGDILEKDEAREFNLILTKGQAFKSAFTIQLRGLMVLSQKVIVSNPLGVQLALGAQELEFSQASNPVSVNVCEGGNITVRFPILAKKNECAQAYCDAEQAGHMLAETIEKQIAKVVQQMQAKKNDATQFPACDITKRYCMFAQLGVASPQVTLYLQNDSLTPNALSYVMKSGPYPRLGSLIVQAEPALKGDAGDGVFATRLGTGFGNAVYLPTIEGCGVYTLSILGGVEVVTNQLQSDKVSIGIKLVQDREKTAECQDKIYNAANFLPRDRSLSIENAQQTRLGVVEYGNAGLKEAAGWLAEAVFGNHSRAVPNSGSNRMTLNVGNLAQSIVELTLDPLTRGEGTKNVITVVRQTQGSVQKEAIVEAGKIITSLGKNVNGCITRDEQTWRIYSVKDVGQFTFEGCPLPNASEGGLQVRSTQTCCTLTTRSDILSDVSYSLTPSGNEPFAGLRNVDLYEVGVPVSSENAFAKPGAKIAYDAAYPLTFDTRSQIYTKEVLLCGTTDPRTQQQANKQTVQTFATRTLDDTKAGPLKLELRTCTLDADDALAKAYTNGNGTWYATLDWDEGTSRKTIMQTLAEAVQGEKLGDAYVTYQGQGILANDNPVYKDKFQEKQRDALLGYGAACALACGVCSAAMPGVGWAAAAWDCGLGCGIPTAVGEAAVYSKEISDAADGTFLEGPANLLTGVSTSVVDPQTGAGNQNTPANVALATGLAYTASRETVKGVKLVNANAKTINENFEKAKAAVKKANDAVGIDVTTAEKALKEATDAGEVLVKNLTDQLAQVEEPLRPMQEKFTQADKSLRQAVANREAAEASFKQVELAIETLPPSDEGAQAVLAQAASARDQAVHAAQSAQEAVDRAREAVTAGKRAAQEAAAAVAQQQLINEGIGKELASLQQAKSAIPDATTIARNLNVENISSNLNARYANLQTLKKDWDKLARLERAEMKAEGAVGKKFIRGNVVTTDGADHVFWKSVRREGDSFVFDLELVTNGVDVPIKNVPIDELSNYGMQDVADRYRVLSASEVAEHSQKFTAEFAGMQNDIQDAVAKLNAVKVQNLSQEVTQLIDGRLSELEALRAKTIAAQDTVLSSIASRKGIPVTYLPKAQVNALSNGMDVIVQTRVEELKRTVASQSDEALFNAGEAKGRLSVLEQDLAQTQRNLATAQNALDDFALKSTLADEVAAVASAEFDEVSRAAGATADELAELSKSRVNARVALLEASEEVRKAQETSQSLANEFGENFEKLSGEQDDLVKKLADAKKAQESATAKATAALKEAKDKKTVPDAAKTGSKYKGLVKSAAKGFVCSGVGNVAGYAAYRYGISSEVENKVELNVGSDAMLDAQTQQMIFEKGQTYAFTVTPAQGEGKSQGISVDIVSPTAQVNPSSWLECD